MRPIVYLNIKIMKLNRNSLLVQDFINLMKHKEMVMVFMSSGLRKIDHFNILKLKKLNLNKDSILDKF
jgi:hypothetical protein